MIEIFLELKSLIHVGLVVEQSWWSNHIVVIVVIEKSNIELLHEEFISESDECTWDILQYNII